MKLHLFSILLPTALVLLLTMPTYANVSAKPRLPVSVSIEPVPGETDNSVPAAGETVTLRLSAMADVDYDSMSLEVLEHNVTIVSGAREWKGIVQRGSVVERFISVKPVKASTGFVRVVLKLFYKGTVVQKQSATYRFGQRTSRSSVQKARTVTRDAKGRAIVEY